MRHRWAVRRMAVLGRLGPSELKSTLRRASLASFGASPLMRGVVFVSCWAAVTVTCLAIAITLFPAVIVAVSSDWWEIPGFSEVFFLSVVAMYLFVSVWMPSWAAMQLGRSALVQRISRWIREGSCVVCGYDLGGISDSERCPECGAPDLRHAGRLDDDAFAASMLGGNGRGGRANRTDRWAARRASPLWETLAGKPPVPQEREKTRLGEPCHELL